MVDRYRYLGIVFKEYLDFNVCIDVLSDAAGRALGSVIGKTKHLKDIGFKSCILPVLEYGSEVWGYKFFKCADNIQERAIRYFLGVHRFTPLSVLRGEVGWHKTQCNRWVNMCRFWNRHIKISDSRNF